MIGKLSNAYWLCWSRRIQINIVIFEQQVFKKTQYFLGLMTVLFQRWQLREMVHRPDPVNGSLVANQKQIHFNITKTQICVLH